MACLPTCPLALQRSELLCVSIAPGSSVDAQQSNVHDKDKEQTQKNHNRKATGRGPAWTGSKAEGSFLACMFNDKSIVCCTAAFSLLVLHLQYACTQLKVQPVSIQNV